jgi:uncharacterized protein (DUF697 family)
MEVPEQSWISRKLSEASIGLNEPHEQARAVIFAAVGVNVGMGAVPFGINMFAFASVDIAMVATVGAIYGYTYSHERAGDLVKSMLTAAGFTTGMYMLAAKIFAESAKATGTAIFPFYALGMSVDMFLTGAVTYAIGFTSKNYFENGAQMSRAQMRRAFKRNLRDGRNRNDETD